MSVFDPFGKALEREKEKEGEDRRWSHRESVCTAAPSGDRLCLPERRLSAECPSHPGPGHFCEKRKLEPLGKVLFGGRHPEKPRLLSHLCGGLAPWGRAGVGMDTGWGSA